MFFSIDDGLIFVSDVADKSVRLRLEDAHILIFRPNYEIIGHCFTEEQFKLNCIWYLKTICNDNIDLFDLEYASIDYGETFITFASAHENASSLNYYIGSNMNDMIDPDIHATTDEWLYEYINSIENESIFDGYTKIYVSWSAVNRDYDGNTMYGNTLLYKKK